MGRVPITRVDLGSDHFQTGSGSSRPCLQMAQVTGRRDFLCGAARYGALAALFGLAAWSAVRSRGQCIKQGLCGECPVFVDCDLPSAQSARERTPKA